MNVPPLVALAAAAVMWILVFTVAFLVWADFRTPIYQWERLQRISGRLVGVMVLLVIAAAAICFSWMAMKGA